jgi:translation initiation factor IF-2
MRIYEFAKEHGLTSKDLIKELALGGFEVSSHMSMLTNQEIEFLNTKYQKPTKTNIPEVVPAPAAQAPSNSAPAHQQRSRFQAEQKQKPFFKKPVQEIPTPPTEILLSSMNPADFAQKIHQPTNDVILTLLRWGIIAPKNMMLDESVIERLAGHYQIAVKHPEAVQEQKEEIHVSEKPDVHARPPVIVIVGHVDHGKTTLLDYIRKSRIAAREKGGITQHLGAYHVTTKHGGIVFLDTPGHEAFSKIRVRGVKTADIAILIVAADDGIMPQTIEAIKAARQMDVPIVVAINKVDKVDPMRLEVVKRQLAEQDLLPEEWGGQVVVMPISAKTGKGVEELLEMIDLQAQLMELKADYAGHAKGYVLESKLEKGRGAVSTVLLQQGRLRIGDYFRAGAVSGRVSSMIDSYGKQLKEVGPTNPVRVAGFDGLPNAGDFFESLSKKDARKPRAEVEQEVNQGVVLREKAIKLIVKTDTISSKEALLDSITKLSKKIKHLDIAIIASGVGDITERDVTLASNTGAAIIGLHVKTEPNAVQLAQRLSLSISLFDIIYKLLEYLQESAEKKKEVKMISKKVGEAVIRKVFDIKKLGIVAGCAVKDGIFVRTGSVVVWRGKHKVGEGLITSLQREGKNVKEVHAGFECAFMAEGLIDFAEDDRVECFITTPEGKA